MSQAGHITSAAQVHNSSFSPSDHETENPHREGFFDRLRKIRKQQEHVSHLLLCCAWGLNSAY